MQGRLAGTEVAVVAIAPGTPEDLRRYRDVLGLSVTLLSDPSWEAHRAYGMGRAGVRKTLLSPRHWLRYAELILRGRKPERPRQDIFALGGDVLVDPAGRIAWAYRSSHLDDYASVDEIERAVAAVS